MTPDESQAAEARASERIPLSTRHSPVQVRRHRGATYQMVCDQRKGPIPPGSIRCPRAMFASRKDSQAHRVRHPAITSAVRGLCRHAGFTWEIWKWTSIEVSRPVLCVGSAACVSQHLCSKKMEAHLLVAARQKLCSDCPPEFFAKACQSAFLLTPLHYIMRRWLSSPRHYRSKR
jgi:hypothetical protein